MIKEPEKKKQMLSKEEFEILKDQHTFYKSLMHTSSGFSPKEIKEKVYAIKQSIMNYEEVEAYNKYAKNICKFPNSPDCEVVFQNRFGHYKVHGNCCPTCAADYALIYSKLQTANPFHIKI